MHLPFILATLSSLNVTFLSSKSVNVVKKKLFPIIWHEQSLSKCHECDSLALNVNGRQDT